MDTLDKLLVHKKKEHEEKMWTIIFNIGWGVKTLDHKRLKMDLRDIYTEKEISRIKEFAVYKRKELGIVLTNYRKNNNLGNYFGVSDDGFWDLTAHIVGFGEERYNSVIDNPEIAREISLNNMYKENFEYIFSNL